MGRHTPIRLVSRSSAPSRSRSSAASQYPGEVLHKVGDKVNYDAKVARTEISGEPEIVKVAMVLGVEAEDMARFMLKKVGDKVKQGETSPSTVPCSV